jgi:cobalt-zinc-cadmium efflux system protein
VAVRFARKKPTGQRSFGYHRGTILAAQANAVILLAASAFVIYEAMHRLRNPSPVRGGIVVVVALAATAVNLLAALTLHEPGSGHGGGNHAGHDHGDQADLNMRSAFLHMMGDAAASLGVAIAGLVIFLTGRFDWLDPAVSIVVAALIGWQAWKLLRATNDVLLESTPSGLDIAALSAAMSEVEGVDDVHDLHVWSLSSEVRALSAHVVLTGDPSLAAAQEVAAAVKQVIGPRFAIAHATLELEGSSCAASGAWCAMDHT